MKLFLLALLPFASAQESEVLMESCHAGTITAPDGVIMTKDMVMGALGPLMKKSVMNTLEMYPNLKVFLGTTGKCQWSCLEPMMKTTFSTLYGKFGEHFFHESGWAIDALTGALRACYPSPPLAEIQTVATSIFQGVEAAVVDKTKDKGKAKDKAKDKDKDKAKDKAKRRRLQDDAPPGLKECANAGHEDDFPLKKNLDAFGAAVREVISKNEHALYYFQTIGKDCQLDCAKKNVGLAMQTLFLTGTDRKDVLNISDSLTGAMHSCWPGVPYYEMNLLVVAALEHAQAQLAMGRLRLYTNQIVQFASSNFFPLCGIVAAMALVLFSAGVAFCRRWKGVRIYRSLDRSDQIELQQDLSLVE